MMNLKKIIGLPYTYLGIQNIFNKGFTSFVELSFKTERIETSNKPYRLYYVEDSKEKLAIDKYFWINTVPTEYKDDIKHQGILGNTIVTLSFNLLIGSIIELKYIRKIKLILKEEGVASPTTLWESPVINLISKKIDIPSMKVNHYFSNNQLTSEIELVWDKDADFNHNSKGINLLLEVKAYNSKQTIKTYRQTAINYYNLITLNDISDKGTYEIKTSIIDLKGYIIQTSTFYHVHQYKPLDIYLKTTNSIFQPVNVFIKLEDGIKKIKSFSSNY